jgi:hypothetical protein
MVPGNPFGVKKAVISVLAGDFYRGGLLGLRLNLFKLIYAVSRLKRLKADNAIAVRLQQLPDISMPENQGSQTGELR